MHIVNKCAKRAVSDGKPLKIAQHPKLDNVKSFTFYVHTSLCKSAQALMQERIFWGACKSVLKSFYVFFLLCAFLWRNFQTICYKLPFIITAVPWKLFGKIWHLENEIFSRKTFGIIRFVVVVSDDILDKQVQWEKNCSIRNI